MNETTTVPKESQETSLAIIRKDISQIQRDITDVSGDIKSIRDDTTNHFATKEEVGYLREKMDFISKILYGFIGMIVIAVIGAILKLVIGA